MSRQTSPPPPGWTLTERRWLRYVFLCAMYFAQGVPWGVMSIALINILAEQGATKKQTGMIYAWSILPWTFKLFWGPMIDSFRLPRLGQRRPWIILAQIGMVLTLLFGFDNPDMTSEAAIATFALVFFIHNSFASLQDVATDALAIDILSEDERGRVNGFMWTSKLAATSAGGVGLATIANYTSFQFGMFIMAGVILLISLLAIFIRERPGDALLFSSGHCEPAAISPDPPTNPIRVARDLLRSIWVPPAFIALFVGFGAFIGEGMAIPVNADIFTGVIGWTSQELSNAQGLWGLLGRLIGGLGFGLLCDRLGARRMVALAASITTASLIAFASTSQWWTEPWYPRSLYILLFELGLAGTSVALFVLFMSIAWTTAAATQFTLYMTMINLGHAQGPHFNKIGLENTTSLFVAGLLSAIPIAIVPFINMKHMKRVQSEEVLATFDTEPN